MTARPHLLVRTLVAVGSGLWGYGMATALAQDKPSPPRPVAQPASKTGAQPGKPPRAAGPTRSEPAPTLLADEPLHADSIGMTFYPPADATVQSTSVGSEAVLQILAKDQTWKIDVRTPHTSNAEVTAEDAGEAIIRQLLESVGTKGPTPNTVRSLGEVLERTHLTPDPGRPELQGYQFFLSLPSLATGSAKEPKVIRGYTVIKVGRQWFAAFDLTTTEPQYQSAKRIYQTVVASAQYADIDQINATRGTAVKAGLSLFERLTPEMFSAAIASRDGRWERLFIPSPTGADGDDKEVAYRKIRCRLGSRGELDPTRPERDWRAEDREKGYILQLDVRYLDGKRTIDSQSAFFMSLDREQEAWTIRNAVREGKQLATTSDIGARSGKSMTVQKEASGRPTYTVKPRFETDGYISQLESYLLPQLMIQVKLPAEYAFYVYSFQDGQVRLRRDVLEQPSDRPGLWRLTTRLSEDAKKAQVSLFNDAGQLIRTELPDGSVWQPVELDRLVSLWRGKNLPMD